jgi:hypothetical protein
MREREVLRSFRAFFLFLAKDLVMMKETSLYLGVRNFP